MKVTCEGHMRRSKKNLWSYLAKYHTHRHHTRYQGTIQQVTSNDISLFDLGHKSRSKVTDVEVSAFSVCFLLHLHKKSCRGYILPSVCLSVCVCVCVCLIVCLSVCEQNADRTATPILTRSSLNSCLLQSLEPY